jgi:hypothetical protein
MLARALQYLLGLGLVVSSSVALVYRSSIGWYCPSGWSMYQHDRLLLARRAQLRRSDFGPIRDLSGAPYVTIQHEPGTLFDISTGTGSRVTQLFEQ